ncbi:MAG: lysophospholipid acyltransferase family protein [Alphaproteobacteria bacterium]|nr:lysophospholipid acyltransferase family protein [Alphaproteobacteria bacterium]MBL6938384.1 lysophospholipid acyltransferase family protein [Alphaproteobacteria bacterium]MBL7096443.1 lysophospholipid acyltransferase family protein [Alphaproteobacteria bacterium]
MAAESTADIDTFSYADPSDPRLKKLFIRIVERMTGQPYLKWLYEENRANPVPGEDFWDAAIRKLELHLRYNEDALAKWPRTGPLVVVANHPFGVLDGLLICHLVAKVRKDFRVLTNAVLLRAEEVKEFLLPVDFAETEEALQTNLKTRAEAKKHLMKGGCLVVFPAGGVSTTPTIWHKRAIDAEWKNLTARLISQARAPVAPVYFAGQNSRLFQIASHISMTLRLSLIFKEVHDRIGSDVYIKIGELLPFERVAGINDRQSVMDTLRDITYSLGEGVPSKVTKAPRRPRRAPGSKAYP